ncbi:MAG TPA: PIN domain nuclease [Terracidiphilus sp.]|nr:PIN domain nuclease [Terracidiphilus sp.]
MVIVDTSVWVDALRGTINPHTVWLGSGVRSGEVGLTSLIVCEVLQGIRKPSQFDGFCNDLLQLPVFEGLSTQVATQSARNYLILRARGITIRKTIDCLIATFCIESGFELLHRDRDFEHFEAHLGLRAKQPTTFP